MTLATASPLSGLFEPNRLERMYYGASSVDKHLPSCLPSPRSKAFIITGSSLATKTPLIQRLEKLLGSHHEGTFSTIKQHAPIAQVDEATNAVTQASVDTLISVGGGSPIDAAKIISYRFHEKSGHFLYHIAIPTTLSAAECTSSGGYTDEKGAKMRVNDPALAPQVVIYDAEFAARRYFRSSKLLFPILWNLSMNLQITESLLIILYLSATTSSSKLRCSTLSDTRMYTNSEIYYRYTTKSMAFDCNQSPGSRRGKHV